MRFPTRVLTGLLSKDHSVATGLLIALTVWTLTRLIDGVTSNATIEYDVQHESATLASGERYAKLSVRLANLSKEESVSDLRVVVYDPRSKTQFVKPARCRFEPPSWAEGGVCTVVVNNGLNFVAPLVVPGTEVGFSVLYRSTAGSTGTASEPVVRIKPGAAAKFRLVRPGVETFIARHESGLLLSLLGLALLLLVLSVGAGVRSASAANKDGGPP